jgi:hypothetical protein
MDKGQCGKEAKLDPGLYKIFDAKWILDWIYEDSSTETLVNFNLSVVLTYVRDSVEERAMELRKTELWGDAWGRQPKGRLG